MNCIVIYQKIMPAEGKATTGVCRLFYPQAHTKKDVTILFFCGIYFGYKKVVSIEYENKTQFMAPNQQLQFLQEKIK